MPDDRGQVLGDYKQELDRRRELSRRHQKKDIVKWAVAVGLIGFGVWPLGIWHGVALLGGLLWAYFASEELAFRLADELDLLEQKVVAQLAQIREERSAT